jgi:hypothetical protein
MEVQVASLAPVHDPQQQLAANMMPPGPHPPTNRPQPFLTAGGGIAPPPAEIA